MSTTEPTTATSTTTPAGESAEPTAGATPTQQPEVATTPQPDPDASSLGDKGKRALDAMKAERNEAKAELRTLREQYEALQAKVDGKEREWQAEQDRRKIEADALAKANERILKAEVRAAAASKLADPRDALLFLDLSEFEVGSDGDVDSSKVAAAIDDLIESRPYLAAQGKRFQGTADAGTRNDPATAKQLTHEEVKGMSAEQIVEAKAKGQLDTLLGKK